MTVEAQIKKESWGRGGDQAGKNAQSFGGKLWKQKSEGKGGALNEFRREFKRDRKEGKRKRDLIWENTEKNNKEVPVETIGRNFGVPRGIKWGGENSGREAEPDKWKKADPMVKKKKWKKPQKKKKGISYVIMRLKGGGICTKKDGWIGLQISEKKKKQSYNRQVRKE